MTKQVVTPERHVVLQAAHCFAVAIEYHRIPIYEGWGWAAPHWGTACMKGLFRHRADVFQGGAAARPRLVSGFGRVPTCTRCLLCKCKSMIRFESWCIVVFNQDVHCMTHTPFPVHQLLQFKSKSKWLLTACKNSMKAALICLTLLLSCASSGTRGVETWGWDEHFAMWQCLARCYGELFQNIKYLTVRWCRHCLSHVLKRCPTHGGPALSFFLECNWIWVEVILMIFLGKEKTTYMEGFVTSHKVVLSSFSSACFQMAELCWTSHKDGQHHWNP